MLDILDLIYYSEGEKNPKYNQKWQKNSWQPAIWYFKV